MEQHKEVDAIVHESGRGQIKDNALKALVTSPLFRTRTEKAKKGKGSYNRKAHRKGHQHKGDAPFDFQVSVKNTLECHAKKKRAHRLAFRHFEVN